MILLSCEEFDNGGIVAIPEGLIGPDGDCRELRVTGILIDRYGMMVLELFQYDLAPRKIPGSLVHMG